MTHIFENIFNLACKLYHTAAVLSVLVLSGLLIPAFAQAADIKLVQPGQCMVNQNPQVAEATVQENTIIVPASNLKAMVEKGFKVVPCARAFASIDAQNAWRDQICTMTATQGEGVQDQLEVLLGERPAVLCGMAEQVLGPWERTSTAANR